RRDSRDCSGYTKAYRSALEAGTTRGRCPIASRCSARRSSTSRPEAMRNCGRSSRTPWPTRSRTTSGSATIACARSTPIEVMTEARDGRFLSMALEEAVECLAHGDVPVGCVVVRGDQVIGRAGNQRELRNDPTAHAEIVALRQAADAVGSWRLE